MSNFDIAVIGAGIAGVSTAWFLKNAGMKVLLIDKSAYPASGGSGAAGAFISPRIGKGGRLQELTNRAFGFAVDFYSYNFPEYFHHTGILRIPKNSDDAEKFKIYEQYNHKPYRIYDQDRLKSIGIEDQGPGFYFPQAGDCDAMRLCEAMVSNINYRQMTVKNIVKSNDIWEIVSDSESIKVPKIILATGYENRLFDMRYMGVKGLWGSRGDYYTDNNIPTTIHKDFTLSSDRDGIVKIGATHIKSPNPCILCDGKPLRGLEERAENLYPNLTIRLKRTLCGMRSTSRDHFPLVGPILDLESMLKKYPALYRGAKVEFEYLNGIYILNGLGGRGFVFAPLMAKYLTDHITEDKTLPPEIIPDRLFYKWVRRVKIHN